MILAMAVSVCAMLTCLLTRSVAALAVALLVMGACAATLQLARQSYVAEVMAVHHRAWAMSTLVASSGSACSSAPSARCR
jgi:hypothetical protein